MHDLCKILSENFFLLDIIGRVHEESALFFINIYVFFGENLLYQVNPD